MHTAESTFHPTTTRGKSSHRKQRGKEGRDYFQSLPYDDLRAAPACGHTLLYIVPIFDREGNLASSACGLCLFREGFATELPTRIHEFKTLAENGNPQTADRFLSHLFLVMGLKPPRPDESLTEFRRKRTHPRAREQYTEPAWGSYPVASALWKLMGYQPPLGHVLVLGVGGQSEIDIAGKLDVSVVNVHIRMAKAVRTAINYIPRN